MSERREPFMAYMDHDILEAWRRGGDEPSSGRVPVVVTPLLLDDPRPGETWITVTGRRVTITGAPFLAERDAWCVPGISDLGRGHWTIASLRRPPALKTFRLDGAYKRPTTMTPFTVEAESRDAALDKLNDALEEVG